MWLKSVKNNESLPIVAGATITEVLCSKLFPISKVRPPEPVLQTVSTKDDVEKTNTKKATVVCEQWVLMQTATVMNTVGNRLTSIRMILDSGSQRTYITEKLSQEPAADVALTGGSQNSNIWIRQAKTDQVVGLQNYSSPSMMEA